VDDAIAIAHRWLTSDWFLTQNQNQAIDILRNIRVYDRWWRDSKWRPRSWRGCSRTRQREIIDREFKKIGFRFVAVDLKGFRSGSLNEGIINKAS
jgi:hypothetical protein